MGSSVVPPKIPKNLDIENKKQPTKRKKKNRWPRMVMTTRVHNVTSGGRSSETSLFKTDDLFLDHSNVGDELREGDEKDRVNHGLEVVPSSLRVRDRRVSCRGWKTDSSAL